MMMDRAKVKEINEGTREALEKVAERFGLTVKVGGGKFDSGTFTPKIVYAEQGNDRVEFEDNAWKVGLRETDFERVVTIQGTRYKLVGINLRAPRYPIVAVDLASGKQFKLTEASVQAALAS